MTNLLKNQIIIDGLEYCNWNRELLENLWKGGSTELRRRLSTLPKWTFCCLRRLSTLQNWPDPQPLPSQTTLCPRPNSMN